MPTPHQLRYSLEQLPDGRFVLVDWAYGLVSGSGSGQRVQQERMRLQAIHACQLHGDANILSLGKKGTAPNWPAGNAPVEREGWLEEQQAISKAYARIGEILRRRKIPAPMVSMDPDVVLAVRQAERLRAAALKRVGLEIPPIPNPGDPEP